MEANPTRTYTADHELGEVCQLRSFSYGIKSSDEDNDDEIDNDDEYITIKIAEWRPPSHTLMTMNLGKCAN